MKAACLALALLVFTDDVTSGNAQRILMMGNVQNFDKTLSARSSPRSAIVHDPSRQSAIGHTMLSYHGSTPATCQGADFASAGHPV